MVEKANIETTNWETVGFDCSQTLTGISFGEGSVISPEKSLTYEPFEFDLEGDPEVFVIYDVYLLDGGDVDIMRTEVGQDSIAIYDGEGEMIHCLMSIEIPAGKPVSELNLILRNVIKAEVVTDENNSPSETTN